MALQGQEFVVCASSKHVSTAVNKEVIQLTQETIHHCMTTRRPLDWRLRASSTYRWTVLCHCLSFSIACQGVCIFLFIQTGNRQMSSCRAHLHSLLLQQLPHSFNLNSSFLSMNGTRIQNQNKSLTFALMFIFLFQYINDHTQNRYESTVFLSRMQNLPSPFRNSSLCSNVH